MRVVSMSPSLSLLLLLSCAKYLHLYWHWYLRNESSLWKHKAFFVLMAPGSQKICSLDCDPTSDLTPEMGEGRFTICCNITSLTFVFNQFFFVYKPFFTIFSLIFRRFRHVLYWIIYFSAAFENALHKLCPGNKLWSSFAKLARWQDRPDGVCNTNEWRTHPGLWKRCGKQDKPASHCSFQYPENFAKPQWTAKYEPRDCVHLLGSQQLHEERWKRISL